MGNKEAELKPTTSSLILLFSVLLSSFLFSWAVQMDNLRGLLGIRRMDRVLNAQIRELYGVMKGEDKRIDEGVLQ